MICPRLFVTLILRVSRVTVATRYVTEDSVRDIESPAAKVSGPNVNAPGPNSLPRNSNMTTFLPNLSTAPVEGGAKKMTLEAHALREYVMGSDGRAKGETTVLLHVSHSNLKQTFFQVQSSPPPCILPDHSCIIQELRLDLHMTIERVKHKLEFHTGTSTMSNQARQLPGHREGNIAL